MRTQDISPDYRKVAKVAPCYICGKRTRSGLLIWVIGEGFQVLHPADAKLFDGAKNGYPIGADCAKKLGKEWTY